MYNAPGFACAVLLLGLCLKTAALQREVCSALEWEKHMLVQHMEYTLIL